MFLSRTLNKIYRLTALEMLQIQVQSEWTPLEKIGPAWHSQVFLETPEGLKTSGFAVDDNPRILPIKALMEALESLAFYDSGLSTKKFQSRNGTAADFHLETAQKRAYAELIERDSFVFHWLAETPGTSLPATFQKSLFKTQKRLPIQTSLYSCELSTSDPSLKTVLLAAKIPKTGCWSLGMGTRTQLKAAFEKARLELLGGIALHARSELCPSEICLQQNDPRSMANREFARSHLNAREESVAELLLHILEGKETKTLRPQTSFEKTRFQQLPTRSSKYFVSFAQNDALLPIYFGKHFKKMSQHYLEHPQFRDLPLGRDFHPPRAYLPHPMD